MYPKGLVITPGLSLWGAVTVSFLLSAILQPTSNQQVSSASYFDIDEHDVFREFEGNEVELGDGRSWEDPSEPTDAERERLILRRFDSPTC
jgi:hypothetical protein